ncbi:hypothetical protein HDU97_009677 [Phlyctochytrium planicorne]|nr:hypothetical protein HDU97_009677 [Phlyctochytrium planicorne]
MTTNIEDVGDDFAIDGSVSEPIRITTISLNDLQSPPTIPTASSSQTLAMRSRMSSVNSTFSFTSSGGGKEASKIKIVGTPKRGVDSKESDGAHQQRSTPDHRQPNNRPRSAWDSSISISKPIKGASLITPSSSQSIFFRGGNHASTPSSRKVSKTFQQGTAASGSTPNVAASTGSISTLTSSSIGSITHLTASPHPDADLESTAIPSNQSTTSLHTSRPSTTTNTNHMSPRKPRSNPMPPSSSTPSLQKRPWTSASDLKSAPTTANRRVSGGAPLHRGSSDPHLLEKRQPIRAVSTPALKPSSSSPALNRGKAALASQRRALKDQYENVLSCRNPSEKELRESLRKLRRMVLADGIPEFDEVSIFSIRSINANMHSQPSSIAKPTVCSLRGKIWKALLGIYRVSALEYVTLTSRGPCDVYDKIKNDTFRTLATDTKFMRKVNEGMIARVLNAFVWKAKDQPPSRLINLKFSYVQGMNVMLAPFLYVMPELDAFFTFTSFIHHTCPLYVQPALEGVHCGIKLLEKCMKLADPTLYRSLRSKNLHPITYAFPSIMTFCACTQPLTEVLKLWDFLLSYGVHLNILCIIAQLILIRDELIKSPSPIKLLRTLPDLNAKAVISIALTLIPMLPESLYDMLVRHPFDPMINDFILPETLEVEGEEELMSSLYVGEGRNPFELDV